MKIVILLVTLLLLTSCNEGKQLTFQEQSELKYQKLIEHATNQILAGKGKGALTLLKMVPPNTLHHTQATHLITLLSREILTVDPEKKLKKIREEWKLGQILIATISMKKGEILTNDKLAVRDMPVKYITEGMLKPNNRGFILGQPIISDLQQGDPIFYYDIDVSAGAESLSKMIRPGGRAVTIKIGDHPKRYNIYPNDHIDLIFTSKKPRQTVTLLENIIVIATCGHTGDTIQKALKEKGNQPLSCNQFTLFMLQEEVELVALAQQMGDIDLMLRHDEERTPLKNNSLSLKDLSSEEQLRQLNKKRFDTIQKPVKTTIIR